MRGLYEQDFAAEEQPPAEPRREGDAAQQAGSVHVLCWLALQGTAAGPNGLAPTIRLVKLQARSTFLAFSRGLCGAGKCEEALRRLGSHRAISEASAVLLPAVRSGISEESTSQEKDLPTTVGFESSVTRAPRHKIASTLTRSLSSSLRALRNAPFSFEAEIAKQLRIRVHYLKHPRVSLRTTSSTLKYNKNLD